MKHKHYPHLCTHPAQHLWLCLLLAMATPVALHGQGTTGTFWQDYLDLWAERYEQATLPEEMLERLEELREEPINLNDTTDSRLQELPFLSPLHTARLHAYIEQTGGLYSIGELLNVIGFDSITIRLLSPFVTVQPHTAPQASSLTDMLSRGRHRIITGTHRTIETARGYTSQAYAGDPYRLYLLYQYKYKEQLQLQLSGDKDPGEALAWNSTQHGFDFYGFHLMLSHIGIMKRTIVGQYRLHFGQGLTLWSGTAPWYSDDTSPWRSGTGAAPASAFCEYGMMQGIATSWALLPQVKLTVFYSYVQRDATLRTDTAEGELPLVRSIYNSGYHRTATELSKKDLLTEQLYGGNLSYRSRNLSIGLTAYGVHYDKSILPYPYPYNQYAFQGHRNLCAGTDVSYRIGSFLLFGEAAMSHNGGTALLGGVQVAPSSNHRFCLLARRYDKSYQNLYAAAWGQSSNVQNENGLYAGYRAVLPWGVEATVSADLFHWPGLRYQIYQPSSGAEYHCRVAKTLGAKATLTGRYSYRNRMKNVTTSPTYYAEECYTHRATAMLKVSPSPHWTWSIRCQYSRYRMESSTATHGTLLLQDLTYQTERQPLPLRATWRVAYFRTDNYDTRLYAAENDLSYEYSLPALYGQGWRTYMVLHCELTKHLTLGLKYSLTYYLHQDTQGSGYAAIDSPHRQEVKLQLRLTL